MIVLDANILIRAILGRRVRQLIETYASQGVRFFAPEVAFDDAETYLPALLQKRGKSAADLPSALGYLRSVIEPVTLNSILPSRKRRACVCAAVMSGIGRYWHRRSRSHARSGPKTRISSVAALPSGQQAASRSFFKSRRNRNRLPKNDVLY